MKKAVIFFTDRESNIIVDSYNLNMAIINSFRDVSEFDNTAIIMDTTVINSISNEYILGENRLGIFVSGNYNDNWDFCVNIKDVRQLRKFIGDHPSISYLYVYSEKSPRYIHEIFMDGNSDVYEINCEWLEAKESPCKIMEALNLILVKEKAYPFFTVTKYLPDTVYNEIYDRIRNNISFTAQCEIDRLLSEAVLKGRVRNYMADRMSGLMYASYYQEIDPGIVFKASPVHIEPIDTDNIISYITGLSIKDPGEH